MEVKAIATILTGLGWVFPILGIIANLGKTESAILFWAGFVFLVVRIGFYISRQLQLRQDKELELERKRRDLNIEKKSERLTKYLSVS